MARRSWEGLPDGVRHAVESQCGPVAQAIDAPAGTARMLDDEARLNPFLPDAAPQLLWQTEADSWRVNIFEHIDGRHADLAPGSGDLPRIAVTVTSLACDSSDTPIQPVEHRWRCPVWHTYLNDPPPDLDSWARDNLDQLATIEATAGDHLNGDALLHTDLVPTNFLIDDRVRVVDWAWPARGAPWTDTALLVIRLIDAGHPHRTRSGGPRPSLPGATPPRRRSPPSSSPSLASGSTASVARPQRRTATD